MMRVSKPSILRMSALLPLTGATTLQVPTWFAKRTRSFCRSLGLFAACPFSPGAVLRGVGGDAGEALIVRQDVHGSGPLWSSGRLRGDSLASKKCSEGENLCLNWDTGLNADEPEPTTI
jgi:hypothetical protein